MSKTYYRILAFLSAFGGIGAAVVGLQYTFKGFRTTDDLLNASVPAFVALPCMALLIYSTNKLASFDSPLVNEAGSAKQASRDNQISTDDKFNEGKDDVS